MCSLPEWCFARGRRENEKLRQEITDMQADRDGSGAMQRLATQLRESEARCQELTAKLRSEEELTRSLQEENAPLLLMVEQSRLQTEMSSKTVEELERKVKNLTAQLKAASSDLDEAAQHELNRQQETERLKQELEMQQMDIVSLQTQLGDVVAEDSAMRMEKDEEIEKMHMRMVSKQEVELAKMDAVALQTKNADLRKAMSEQDDLLRLKLKEITALELQLAEASSMWHAAARDGQDLRKQILDLEAREPETAAAERELKRQIDDKKGEVGKKVDELLDSNKRIAALTIETHALTGRLAQSRADHTDCLKRLSEISRNTVPVDVHVRTKDAAERALAAQTQANLRLKRDNELLRDHLGQRSFSAIGYLHNLRDQMVGLENTMQVIEQTGFTLKTDTLHELSRVQVASLPCARPGLEMLILAKA
jgi:chromosome segregation ATPase